MSEQSVDYRVRDGGFVKVEQVNMGTEEEKEFWREAKVVMLKLFMLAEKGKIDAHIEIESDWRTGKITRIAINPPSDYRNREW